MKRETVTNGEKDMLKRWIAEGRPVGVDDDGTAHYYGVAVNTSTGLATLQYVTKRRGERSTYEWTATTYAAGEREAYEHLGRLNFPVGAR